MAEGTSENNNAVLATITTNADGWFQAVSPQFLELIGRPVEALAGVNLFDLVHPLQAAQVRGLLAAPTSDSITTRLFGPDDQWIPIALSVGQVNEGRLTLRLQSEHAAIAPRDVATPASAPRAEPAAVVPAQAPTPQPVPVVPAMPAEVDAEFPYADSDAHMAYVASMPADDVPALRDAVRSSVGDDTTPILEIDVQGRTTFVRGAWAELSAEDANGADVFEELLSKSPRADEILDGLATVFETGKSHDFDVAVPGIPSRWVRLMPIPSPHAAGVVHALVAVVPESQLRASAVVPVASPSVHTIGAAAVTPAAVTPADGASRVVAAPNSDDAAEATEVLADATATEPTAPAGRRPLLLAMGVLAAIVVVWSLYAASSDPEPVASPFQQRATPEPVVAEPVNTELAPTEPTQVNDVQTWRSVGAVVLGELHAIAATPEGAFVADVDGRLVRLDEQATALGASSVSGNSATFISDIAADAAGGVWVLDAGLGRISRVDSGGNARVIETETGPLLNARGVGTGTNGTVWVASTAAAQLLQFDGDGTIVATIALEQRQPSDVVQAADGSLWVIDAESLELLHLSESGELLTALPIDFFGSLESPHLVIVDDVVWVTEPEMSAVFAVDATTGESTGDRFELARPDGSAVFKPIGIGAGADGRLWIVDSLGGGIIIIDA